MSSPFIHTRALVEPGASIGAGTKVWAFAHILPGATIGEDCNICDHTFIEGKAVIGNRVTIKCGVYVWNDIIIEDDVFIGPSAVLTNDPAPRSRNTNWTSLPTVLKKGCSIGAGAVITPGRTIGAYAMVGAGAVVTHDVEAQALVIGNPAKFYNWVCHCGKKLTLAPPNDWRCQNCSRIYCLTDGVLHIKAVP
jgi:UDP-2-acetamido-3-amino-2,3-dideoxy-glucuronate N-acetyltransferase